MKMCKTCNSFYENEKKAFCSAKCYHIFKKKLMSRPENNPNSKLSIDDVKKVIELNVKGLPTAEIARQFKVTGTCIGDILNGKSWKELDRAGVITGTRKQKLSKLPQLTKIQKDIIYASLLGDGSIIPQKNGNARFAKKQKIKNECYINWHAEMLKPYSKTPLIEKNGIYQAISVKTCNHEIFSSMRSEWYREKTKIVPEDIKLTKLMVAIWFCDDGTHSRNSKKAVFCTDCFDIKYIENLSNILSNLLNIKTKINYIKPSKKMYPRIYIGAGYIEEFFAQIKPEIIWPCFNYKLGEYADGLQQP